MVRGGEGRGAPSRVQPPTVSSMRGEEQGVWQDQEEREDASWSKRSGLCVLLVRRKGLREGGMTSGQDSLDKSNDKSDQNFAGNN